MSRNRFTQVGLDRLVRYTWFERVASLALAGEDAKGIKPILQDELKGSFRSENVIVRGSVDKTLTILFRVWLTPPVELKPLRHEGLHLLQELPRRAHLPIHWGMVMAVYPFWSSVATQVGRLLKLQGTVSAIQVQRRIREQYGERETVARRARYVLRSFLDWGVLKETGSKGVYLPADSFAISEPSVTAWLLEASLHARPSGSAPIGELIEAPNLFPFRFKNLHPEQLLADSKRLEVVRHGLDHNLLIFRDPRVVGRE